MQRKIIWLLAVFSLIFPALAIAADNNAQNIIVSGKGVITADPDVAYVMLGIERTEKTATEAQNVAAQKMENILASLDRIGIPKNKIETTAINLYPKYEYSNGKSEFVGYTAGNQIKITVDDLGRTGKVVDAAVNAGANNVGSISFSLKNTAPQKTEALKKAFQNAEEKAKIIAAASGLNLKKIARIQEADAEILPLRGIQTFKAAAVSVPAPIETPVSPGKVEIQGNLTVIYECF
jgi:hypothetical protein